MKPEYQLTADEVVHALETDAAEGLTADGWPATGSISSGRSDCIGNLNNLFF